MHAEKQRNRFDLDNCRNSDHNPQEAAAQPEAA